MSLKYGNAVAIDGAEIGVDLRIDGAEACLSQQAGGDLGVLYPVGGGTMLHDRLQNRDLPDQHPIAAITGLQDALDSKVNVIDISVIYCGTSTEVV